MEEQDDKLIKDCIAGKRKAQFQLYQKYENRMYGICLRYAKDKEEAMDILQEGFIRIFKGLHSYKKKSPLKNWMDRVMANAAIRFISKNKKIVFQENQDLEKLMKPYDSVNQQYNANEILFFINQLPIGYKTVFNMFAIEGYSHKEIGEKLNISEGTSRSQYARAKKAMQNILEKNKMI